MCSKKIPSLVISRPFEVFLAVASHRSYTLAGKRLGITQSAVSQQIATLQKHLGFDLFEKGQRPLKLTPEALILRSELQTQNANLEQIIQSIQKRNSYKPILKIGTVESIIYNLASFFFQSVLKDFSKVHLQSGVTNDLIEKLTSGKVDVVIASDHALDSEKFLKVFLFSEPYILITPKQIAQKKTTWDWDSMRLIGLPFAHYTSNTSTSWQTEQYFNEQEGLIPSRIEVDSNRLVFSLVQSGMAWGITQPSALLAEGEEMFTNLNIGPVPGQMAHRSIYAYSRNDYPLSWLHNVRDIFLEGIRSEMIPKLVRSLEKYPDLQKAFEIADKESSN